jgi:FKBP-type peptidyl-prolyl cis-trans isomerase 2
MKMARRILWLGLVIMVLMGTQQVKGAKKMSIKDGSKVSFEYTLTVDGEVVDTSKGRGPFEYTQGSGQIIPGLAKQLVGMKAGDEKKITISPEEGYGVFNPEAVKEIPKTSLPPDVDVKPGMYLQMKTNTGQQVPIRVTDVKENAVVLDLNHPLAGKTLDFDVKIVSVQ